MRFEMPKKTPTTDGTPSLLNQRALLGDPKCSVEQKLLLMQGIREESDEAASHLDLFLLGEVTRLREGLQTATHHQARLRDLLESFTSSPWYPAVLIDLVATPQGQRAIVSVGGSYRVVALADDVDTSSLARGDEVFLAKESSILTGKSPCPTLRCGETVVVARDLPDGRIVVRWREEEVVISLAEPLREAQLRPGDLVRWDRSAWMAFEKVDRNDGAHQFLEETPPRVVRRHRRARCADRGPSALHPPPPLSSGRRSSVSTSSQELDLAGRSARHRQDNAGAGIGPMGGRDQSIGSVPVHEH